jgi:hypothetical protein
MSADFEKILVKDPRLDVSDSIKYAVVKGGQNVTVAPFKRISESTSQIVFNIQVPSEQTIVDRRVLLHTKLTVVATGSSSYGINEALAAFPLAQLMTVLSVTINNNTVSINMQDALPVIIRMLCEDDLSWYNSSSPTFADMLGNYGIVGGLNNANSALWGCNDSHRAHRGSFAPVSYASGSGTYVFDLYEPLLISPFIYGNLKANNQGFYGIQNMNIIINLASNGSRVWRGPSTRGGSLSFADPSYSASTVSGVSFSVNDSTLLFNFLTPHPSDLMPARNIVPFYELPRYITSSSDAVSAAVYSGVNTTTPGGTSNISLNTLQLNQIPDKLFLYCRLAANKQSWGNPDVALPITQVAIQFNNNAGILSTATQGNLWQMSRDNGITSTWTDWVGVGVCGSTSAQGGTISLQPTVGSYLCLEFGKDIQLTEDFYAAGSLGNFNLQVNVTVQNNTLYAINASGAPELEVVLITMNSGVFVNERGTSSTYTGILTKQDVLEASQQDHYTYNDIERMVGGGVMGFLKSVGKKVVSKAKSHLQEHGADYANMAKEHAMKVGKKHLDKYLQ